MTGEHALRRATLDTERVRLQEGVTAGTNGLSSLKTAYKDAVKNNAFPMAWKGYTFTREQTETGLLKLNREVTGTLALLAQATESMTEIDAHGIQISENRFLAQEKLSKISMTKQSIRILGVSQDLKNSMREIKTLLDTPIFTGSSKTEVPSISDLAQRHDTQGVDKAELNAILGAK